MAVAKAGWYPDPEIAGSLRLWDGQTWTDDRAPMPTTPAREPLTAERFHNLAYFLLWLNIIGGAIFLLAMMADSGM